MRRAAACLRLATVEAAAARGRSGAAAASAASGSSGSGSGSSLLAALRSAASKAGLPSAGQVVVQHAASSAATSCSGGSPAALGAAALLAASRRGLHAAARSHHPAGLPPLPLMRMQARLSTRAGLAAEAAEAAAAAVPASWAARGGMVRSRVSAARRHLACRVEWVLGRGYHAREAFFNAIYMQPNWSKSLLLLLAERLTRGDPRFAWCYSTPVAELEQQLCEQAEEEPAHLTPLQRARRWAASLARLAWLLLLFSPVVLSAPFVGDLLGISRARWLRLLRWTLERAGPAFIKWGQWAATRHDLFPPDFCDELELLHSQAPAHALPFTEAAVRQCFGFGVADLFSSFEPEPVASGSIGQIHRAVLSDTGARLTGMDPGTVVAVKVRHPGVSEAIERDFALMMVAAQLAAQLPALSSFRLEESLKQFAAPLREQVDLAREATHLHAFNYNFRKTGGVSFPVPLYPLVSPGVLVETFEAGTHISAYVARGPGAPHNSELARLGARTMLHMMIVDNLIHADLHPGNILVKLDLPFGHFNGLVAAAARGAAALGLDTSALDSWRRAKLVLLDAGMATRLSPEDQRNMFGLFEAFAEMDGARLADWVLRFSGEDQSCPDAAAFRRDVAGFFDRLTAETTTTGKTHGADALADVMELVRTHQVSMPGHICATVVTTMVLEGWSNQLDPDHSTLQEVKRMVVAAKGGWLGILREIMIHGEMAADSEVMERVALLEPALMKV
ncbi:hypothetical protein ABPG75_003315 [Micractinium tetrahymenae]